MKLKFFYPKVLRTGLLAAVFIIGVFFLQACGSKTQGKYVFSYELKSYAEPVKFQHVKQDSFSFYYYLPQGKLSESQPLIMVFDAHGDVQKLMRWLKPAAQRYGFAMAGTDLIRNNVSNISVLLQRLYSFSQQYCHPQYGRIYTVGFSGGGRIAMVLALSDTSIGASASMSAGLGMMPYLNNPNAEFIIFAGTRDFNYREVMEQSAKIADKLGVRALELSFRGAHQYPPKQYADYVLLWFEASAIRQGKISAKSGLTDTIKKFVNTIIAQSEGVEQQLQAYKAAQAFLSGISDTKQYAKKLRKLEQTPEFKAYAHKLAKIEQMETQLQREYAQAIMTKDTTWWKHEIEVINSKISTARDSDYKDFYYRLKAFVSIMAYTATKYSIFKGNYAAARKYVAIYQVVDPKNPDVYFFKACLAAHDNNTKMAERMFSVALKYGFNDFSRIGQYPCYKKFDWEKVKQQADGRF